MNKRVLYAVGCYGTGNLGDDAIFNGLCNFYSDWHIIQGYSLRPTYRPCVNALELRDKGFFQGNRLIIGGGGLFFDKTITGDFCQIAVNAKSVGMEVEIQRVGLENAHPDCYAEIREIAELCQTVTVRSRESLRIARDEIGLERVSIASDFAYGLKPDINSAKAIFPEFDERPVVGLATAGSADTRFIAHVVSLLTTEVNVLHIPHAKHYDDPNNNEIATGELIWSDISVYYGDKLHRYKCLPYPTTPETLLGVYHLIDLVLGYRYHSFIFAEMADKPLYGMPSGAKAMAFFREHTQYSYSDGTETREQIVSKVVTLLEHSGYRIEQAVLSLCNA